MRSRSPAEGVVKPRIFGRMPLEVKADPALKRGTEARGPCRYGTSTLRERVKLLLHRPSLLG